MNAGLNLRIMFIGKKKEACQKEKCYMLKVNCSLLYWCNVPRGAG